MPVPPIHPAQLRPLCLPGLLATLACLCLSAHAATIGPGSVSTTLGPSFFVNDATTGGGDITVTQPAIASYTRSFEDLITRNQGPTRITLTGFGFATSATASENTATSVTLTVTYLGADEAVDGGDDLPLGAATGTYAYNGAGEYSFKFDEPLQADLPITGTRFRIQVAPGNATNNGKLRFKTGPLTFESTTGPKLSIAGTATARRLNLAKFQPVTASSTNGQRLASYVTDGVVGNDNRWQSTNSGPHWAEVTFPHPVTIGSAQTFTGVDDGSPQTSFKLQSLQSGSWVDIPGASVTGNSNVEHHFIFPSPVTSTAFRIQSGNTTLRVRELALYPPNGTAGFPLGTDLTLNLAHQRPAIASSNSPGNFALLAVDGKVNRASMWQTTQTGPTSLEIDLRVSTKIGSAHLHSGSPGVPPLAAFMLSYWNGSSWLEIPGTATTGNTAAALAIPFSTPVTTTRVRLDFTNPGTTSVRELCIFPANPGNPGYPLGTSVIGNPPATTTYDAFHDAYHTLTTAARAISILNGTPVLSDPSTTTSHYQLLLNHDTGTYRLRNRATGNCLSGPRLDTTPGAALLDLPYSALPDQDWLLVPAGPSQFTLINQWSGLAIDTQASATTPGTPLVQALPTTAPTQRWQVNYAEHYPKKGIGGTSFAAPFNARWTYNWGQRTTNVLPPGSIFNPMQWGNFNWDIGSNAGPLWQFHPTWRTTGGALHLLGFNEPDGADQANMTVESAVTLWPRLLSMNTPLISPAPASMNNGWLATFYTEATRLGYRVDHTALHTYPGPSGGSADNLISTLQSGFTQWGRPVWLTEFSFVNWSGTGTWTEEDNYNTLAEFLWRAENLPWLRKYALFVFSETGSNPSPAPAQPWSAVGPRSNSYDADGNLTAFGKLYAAWDCDATARTGKNYYIHHRGTRKRLANTLASTPGANTIRNDDVSGKWSLVSAGTTNRYYIVSARDGRRLSSDGSTVTHAAAGTTTTAAQWSLTEDQHGWYYLGHPASSKRLSLAYNNTTGVATYTMAANTTTNDAAKWRFIVPPQAPVWSGAAGSSWQNSRSWIPGIQPATGDSVTFDSASLANLTTFLDQPFDLDGITVKDPAGPITIAGSHPLTLRGGGLNLSTASQNLSITAPIQLGASQTWNVATGRTLEIFNTVSGSFPLSITGEGKVILRAAASHTGSTTINAAATLQKGIAQSLPSGPSAGSLLVNGTLDLNGFPQSLNTLTGTGQVENTAPTAAALTVGEADTAVTLSCTLQNTGGPLALVKIGSGSLTLTRPSTHSGGLTNQGSGNVNPQHNSAFGTGPVVMNAGTIYPNSGSFTFNNPLTLNNAALRIGGGNNRSLTWAGPVHVTGASSLNADGGTTGITLTDELNLGDANPTLTSFANNTTNTLAGPVSGTSGTLTVTGGTLNLNTANPFAGTVRATLGTLRTNHPLALQHATLDLPAADSGTITLNNLNATLGALTGSRNLALGSGIISIGNNHASTTYTGTLSGTGALVKIGTGSLTLAGPNAYTGPTTVQSGTLALGANHTLPNTPLLLGNATLNAATFTDALGPLDVTGPNATLHLGTGASLTFANSSAIDWAGGSLKLTGTFVPGVSLRFGTTANGLTAAQLSSISAPSIAALDLNEQGFLVIATPPGYDTWKSQITNGLDARTDDSDADGFSNLQEFLFGTSPIAPTPALVTTTATGSTLTLRWLQRRSGATYTVTESTTLASWLPLTSPTPAPASDQTGATPDYEIFTLTLPTNTTSTFFRIEATELSPTP